jgi:phosphomethylpyrimidine synthase
MATLQTSFTSLVTKKHNNCHLYKFTPGFELRTTQAADRNYLVKGFVSPRATLAADKRISVGESVPNLPKQKKHTVNPAAPDFLPLPSFEECFPRSTKEYTYGSFFPTFLLHVLFIIACFMK